MIEILGEAVADLVPPSPFSHSFRDASDYSRATIAQWNHRLNFPGNDYRCSAIGGRAGHLDAIVKLLLTGELGLEVDLADVHRRLSFAHHEAARMLAAVAVYRDRCHPAGSLIEVHREPSIELGRLPVARTPAMVAQPEAIEFEIMCGAFDLQRTGRMTQLLEVPLGKLLCRITRCHEAFPSTRSLLVSSPPHPGAVPR